MCFSEGLEAETRLGVENPIPADVAESEKPSFDSSGHSSAQSSSAKGTDLVLESQNSNSGHPPNAGQNPPPQVDAAEFIRDNLSQLMSPQIHSDLPESKDSGKTIDEINSQAVTSLIGILENIEKERLKQQRPLRNCLLFFVGGAIIFL